MSTTTKRPRVKPAHPLRIYQTPTGPRVYFTVASLEAASASDVGTRWHREARHIEAVHKSGRARVLKSTGGEEGYIDATTEGRPVPPATGMALELETALKKAVAGSTKGSK